MRLRISVGHRIWGDVPRLTDVTPEAMTCTTHTALQQRFDLVKFGAQIGGHFFL
jgi:hypothetical protein